MRCRIRFDESRKPGAFSGTLVMSERQTVRAGVTRVGAPGSRPEQGSLSGDPLVLVTSETRTTRLDLFFNAPLPSAGVCLLKHSGLAADQPPSRRVRRRRGRERCSFPPNRWRDGRDTLHLRAERRSLQPISPQSLTHLPRRIFNGRTEPPGPTPGPGRPNLTYMTQDDSDFKEKIVGLRDFPNPSANPAPYPPSGAGFPIPPHPPTRAVFLDQPVPDHPTSTPAHRSTMVRSD